MDKKNKHYFCVSDFGAVGDGKADDTSAIQSTIDKIAASGGGKIYFDPGNYLIGTIYLKSNVSLYLEVGATIIGSFNIEDYPKDNYCKTFASGALFIGDGVENVSIEGFGAIDGSGPAFWEDFKCNEYALKPKQRRPHATFFMVKSKNISIKDVKIKNAPCYTIWILGCDNVRISGVDIDNPLNGPNTDAIDIDCSCNVLISDCNIKSGDDCIALKSDIKRLGENKECKNIVVNNCILCSSTCAIRVGYEGDGVIKNCTFSNLVIYDTGKGIDIISILPDLKIPFTEISLGAKISNLIFSNIVMENVKQAIYIWQGDETGKVLQGQIEQIEINNVIADSYFASFIGSLIDKPIKGLTLNNVKIIIKGHLDKKGFESPCVWSCPQIPWGLYMKNIDNLSLNCVQVSFVGASGPWESLVKLESCKDIELNSLKTNSDIFPELVPIILYSCVKAVIFNLNYNSKAEPLFLIQGNETSSIRFVSNNLFEVERLFQLERHVKKDEVQY